MIKKTTGRYSIDLAMAELDRQETADGRVADDQRLMPDESKESKADVGIQSITSYTKRYVPYH